VYAAKPGVGYTGLRALRYQGSHLGHGPAHVTNLLADVSLPVGPDTELRYLICPDLPDGELRYPGTFVAVDLEFADGGRLSELAAVDQLGFGLGAAAQGASRALYPGQWNVRRCAVGAVAAGRTVTRILLSYSGADGPVEFGGWLDDLSVLDTPRAAPRRPVEHVLTTRGTHSSRDFSRGNTVPATAVPNGFNFWTPVTDASTLEWLYSWHQHNDAANQPRLQAIGISHQPSPWMGDRHTFQMLPWVGQGTPPGDRVGRALPFDHANEYARPHRYRIAFDNGATVDLAPTDHAAIVRVSAPGPVCLVFDNVTVAGELRLDPAGRRLSAYSDVRSGLSVGAGRMFVHAEFDAEVVGSGELSRADGRPAGYLRFASAEVTMRIATSLISPEQAVHNLALELAGDDTVDTVAVRAADAWDELLGRVTVTGATEDQLATLYGCLYRLFLYPNSGHENAGTAVVPRYRHASPVLAGRVVDAKVAVNNGFWDTYRTCWPAYALLAPERCGELVDGFLQLYRDSGWVPRWSSPGHADLMTGTSSDVAFADAYLKGVPGFDVETAFESALRDATVDPPTGDLGRRGLYRSVFRRYTDTDIREGLSWTLEGCLNDFGIANLAERLGRPDEHAYFADRARNYVHSFDQRIGFFQGRTPDGRWRLDRDSYDPRVWGHDYTETNGWNTAFGAPHDGAALAALYGGPDAFAGLLDEFFTEPETAGFPGSYRQVIHEMTEARDVRLGQYGHSNQPSHHIPWLYTHTSRPWRTAEVVREVLARLYSGSEIGQGYCGDEDNGEMSAWWLFAALGLYPLEVGSPRYVIGSPLFSRAVVRLAGGELVIDAPAAPGEIHVRSLLVDGEPWRSPFLPHERIVGGAELTFTMGSQPTAWADPQPPAPRPRTLRDATADPLVTARGSGTGSVAALFDDVTRTEYALGGPAGFVEVGLPAEARVTLYTLTSGAQPGDPVAWTLSGSVDGDTWQQLDARVAEAFRWRRQTRPFLVANPGAYRHYRLAVTTGTGPVSLAQLELLSE
jgi:putative alpha-1,2-mannosidase